jgi:hypothetical protein
LLFWYVVLLLSTLEALDALESNVLEGLFEGLDALDELEEKLLEGELEKLFEGLE